MHGFAAGVLVSCVACFIMVIGNQFVVRSRLMLCVSTKCTLLFTGIDLAQGLLARAKASPSPGAIPQRRMVVISHPMTRNMTELCCIYVSCVY